MGGNLSTEAVASSRLRVTRERSITHSNSSAEGTTPTRRVPSFTLQQPQPKVPLPGTTTATTKVTGTSSAHSPANSVLKRDEREDSSANSVPETVSVPANPRPSTDTVNDSNSDSDSYWDLDIGYSPQAGILNATAAKTWHPNNSTNRRSLDLREYHTVDSSDYTLPSDEIEQSRIELQHYTLRHVFKNDIVCSSARKMLETTPNAKVLDVGCAKGYWLDSVQKVYPYAEYHGVDIAEAILSRPQAPRKAKIVFGNVLDRLPYPDNIFDFVHQRILFMGIPKHCYVPAIRELIRVTKPGGFIELLEPDSVFGNMGPKTEKFMGLFHDAVTMKANIDVLAGTNLGFYVKVQGREFVGKKGIRAARVPLNWNGPIGKMAAAGLEEGLTAMSDFLHTAFSVSREEYAEMVQECKDEWETSRTTINYQVVYFEKAQDRLKDD